MATLPKWEEVRDDLRREWESTTLGLRRPWEEVADDVRFGYEMGISEEFQQAAWDEVRDLLQRRWEERYPHARFEDWRGVEEAVRLGFMRAKEELERAGVI